MVAVSHARAGKMAHCPPFSSCPAPFECTIEVYTEGERRTLARGNLLEIDLGLFSVFPVTLREITGAAVPWTSPECGKPIASGLGFDQAREALCWWATKTVAEKAYPYR